MRFEEIGDFRQSYQELQRPDISKLPPYYGSLAEMSMMFHELVYFGDESSVGKARERLESKSKKELFFKFLKMKHPSILPFQASKKAFLDNDIEGASETVALARKLLPTMQNPGMEHSLGLALDRLEERMRTVE
jgi:hypothetical protein